MVGAPDSRYPTMSVLNTQRPNWNPARSKTLPNEIQFSEAKLKLQQFTGSKGPIRKIKKPVGVLS
jgi:hypothetical protein